MNKRIIVVIGTRPDAIKMAPVIKTLRKYTSHEVVVLSTGQHRDLLPQALGSFDLRFDYDLELFHSGQSLSQFHGVAVQKLSEFYAEHKPDCVLYHGDTATAYAAAVAAFYMHIPHVHIEAGLRSHNLDSPYPEEFHRKMISQMSSYHFVPSESERDELMREGINEKVISVVGNTISDAVHEILEQVTLPREPRSLKSIVVTLHRREKSLDQLWGIFVQLKLFLDLNREYEIHFPLHPNPLFTRAAHESFGDHNRVQLLPSLEYAEMLRLLSRSECVVTDSGGVQEECTLLGKKVFVMRDATERALLVNAELISPDQPEKLFQRLSDFSSLAEVHELSPGLRVLPNVSSQIVDIIERKVLCS